MLPIDLPWTLPILRRSAMVEASGILSDSTSRSKRATVHPESLISPRFPLVATRVGIIFVLVSIGILTCSLAAHAPFAAGQSKINALMWIAALAICCAIS